MGDNANMTVFIPVWLLAIGALNVGFVAGMLVQAARSKDDFIDEVAAWDSDDLKRWQSKRGASKIGDQYE
jgi:hypothetical protein